MSKSNGAETGFLELVLENKIASGGVLEDIGSGIQASGTAGDLYLALHTADPGESGDQTTSEATYDNYARTAIARQDASWTVSGNQAVNAADIDCPTADPGTPTNVLKFWSLGTDASGAGNILYRGHIGEAVKSGTGKASNDTLTVPGHTLAVDDEIVFYALAGDTLPTGITEGVVYFVKTVSGNDLTISTTQGGATLNVTADGAFVVGRVVSITVTQNIQPTFPAGQLSIAEH
jgi:hypothetical protein